jgi:hypothetical protein
VRIQSNDGQGGTDDDTVSITVLAPPNQPPVNMVPGAQSTNEDTPLTFSTGGGNAISISDSDAGGASVQVALSVGHGTVTLNGTAGLTVTAGADGSAAVTVRGTIASLNAALNGLSYAPTANYNSPDTLQIVTNDLGNTGSGGAQSDTDTVTITVNAVNDAPVASNDTYSTPEDTPLTVPAPGVLGNNTDAESDPLTAVLDANPANGTLTLNADGSFDYVPNPGFFGVDSFTYHANDGSLDSGVATGAIDVGLVNGDTRAIDDAAEVGMDSSIAVNVLANDIDPDGDPLHIADVGRPSHGQAVAENGRIVYTPVPVLSAPMYSVTRLLMTSAAQIQPP